MRVIAFSLVTCAITSACLMAVLVYALHLPTRAALLLQNPPAAALPADPSDGPSNWPEQWAATHLRTIE
jgi:hypothetical protein